MSVYEKHLLDAETDAPVPLARDRLPPEKLEELWQALANPKGEVGWKATQQLRAAPADAVVLLRDKVKPVLEVKTSPAEIDQWIADLDSESFATREQAAGRLREIGGKARPALEKVLRSKPPLEVQKRAKDLLDELDQAYHSPSLLRPLRAIELLERIGTPESRQVLRSLAGGLAEARVTCEAKATLARLACQKSIP